MKKIFVFALFSMCLAFANQAEAQQKIGYISLQELIPAMPEYKKASEEMTEFQKALQIQGAEMESELSRKDSIYRADSTKWTPAMREIKRKELNDLYMKIVNFQQSAQQEVGKKEQSLLGPIQQKAITTTQTVAKELGYAFVLSKEQLIAFPTADDLLPAVAKKLNITIPAGGGAGAPPATRPPAGRP